MAHQKRIESLHKELQRSFRMGRGNILITLERDPVRSDMISLAVFVNRLA